MDSVKSVKEKHLHKVNEKHFNLAKSTRACFSHSSSVPTAQILQALKGIENIMGMQSYKGHTALEYAMQACDMMMKKYQPADLPPKGKFYYHQGVFMSGMQKVYEISKKERYYGYVKSWVDSVVREDGSIHFMDKGQLDYIQPGILLYQLYERTKEERYRKALYMLRRIIKDYPTNAEGGFWHNEGSPDQMWLDGIYMAGPIFAHYAAAFGEEELFNIVAYQALLMERKMKDPVTGLMYHAWDSRKTMPWADPENGLSGEFWGRAMGWVTIGVLDVLDYLPEDHKDRKELIRMVTELIKAIAGYQDESGLWYQVINKAGLEGNWLESSCTCLYTGAIIKAVRKGFLDEGYLEIAEKGYRGIIERLRYEEGEVIFDNICVGTGAGDYGHYCGRPTSVNDLHGVGAFLIMCSEAAQV